jgi:hypothetical protein
MQEDIDIEVRLDEMEARLEAVHTALGEGRFNDASAKADGVSNIIDCALCESLESGVLGGVMFAAAFTESGQDDRVEFVRDEIRRFIDEDLQAARETVSGEADLPPHIQP